MSACLEDNSDYCAYDCDADNWSDVVAGVFLAAVGSVSRWYSESRWYSVAGRNFTVSEVVGSFALGNGVGCELAGTTAGLEPGQGATVVGETVVALQQ